MKKSLKPFPASERRDYSPTSPGGRAQDRPPFLDWGKGSGIRHRAEGGHGQFGSALEEVGWAGCGAFAIPLFSGP
jgi:hypothetical protein